MGNLEFILSGKKDENGFDIEYDIVGVNIITPNSKKNRKAKITVHAVRDLVTPTGIIPHPKPQCGYALEEGSFSFDVDGEQLFKVVRDEHGEVVYDEDGKSILILDEDDNPIPRNNACIGLLSKLKAVMGDELWFKFKEFNKLF